MNISFDKLMQNFQKVLFEKFPNGHNNMNISRYAMAKYRKLKVYYQSDQQEAKATYRLKIKKLVRLQEANL